MNLIYCKHYRKKDIIMSRTRRNFSAKFKSELVIELLKGEKDLNTIATENNIQPNLLRNWKKEFLDKASVVFNDTREDRSVPPLFCDSYRSRSLFFVLTDSGICI